MSRHPLTGFRPPAAPAGLKARVLALRGGGAAPRHPLDRLSESVLARWIWATAVVALLALLTGRNPPEERRISAIAASHQILSIDGVDARVWQPTPSLAALRRELVGEL